MLYQTIKNNIIMERVLRNNQGEITHLHYTTFNGSNVYLTKEAFERMYDFSGKDVEQYYSGEDHEEVDSLKEDIASILTGDISMEVIKLNIAKHSGLIKKHEIMEVNG